jgi:hypothetical protein
MTPLVQHREVSLPPCADADVTAIFASLFGFLGLLLATSLFSRARASELSILLASALAAGGVWIFIEIAEEMLEGETRRLDEALLLSLRNSAALADPIGPPWFEEVMRDFYIPRRHGYPRGALSGYFGRSAAAEKTRDGVVHGGSRYRRFYT